MTSIIREQDQVHFIIGAYREVVPVTRRRLLRYEMETLAEQQGHYLQIFSRPNQQLEIVSAKESGYLLGETVWQYLGEPEQMIFCEQLADSGEVLLVIVCNNNVFLDAKLPASQVKAEILPLLAGDVRYSIYVWGDVPLQQQQKAGGFVLPADKVQSFEQLDQALLPRLPALSIFQLLPLPLALKSPLLGRGFPIWQTVILAFVLVIGAWWLWSPHKPNFNYRPQFKHHQDPWRAYRAALQSPAPSRRLQQVTKFIEHLYFAPGWQVINVDVNGSHFSANLQVDGGSLTELSAWSKQQGYHFNISSKAPSVSTVLSAKSRALPAKLLNTQMVVTQVIDELDQLLATQTVSIGDTKQLGHARQISLTIHVNNVSPDIIDLLGETLRAYPLTLGAIHFKINNQLISGSIQISAWGS